MNDSNEETQVLLGRRKLIQSALLSQTALLGLALTPIYASSKQVSSVPSSIDLKLQSLGVELPSVIEPVANYKSYSIANDLIFLSGHLPFKNGELIFPGLVGREVSVAQAKQAAQTIAINLLASLKHACDGDLSQVEQCVRLSGFVACGDDFNRQSEVLNGASDFIVKLFGDKGKHSRTAVGVSSLPLGSSVEISAIFQI